MKIVDENLESRKILFEGKKVEKNSFNLYCNNIVFINILMRVSLNI